MKYLYEKLKYTTNSPIPGRQWLGNLRWYVREAHQPERYQFECIDARETLSHKECTAKKMTEQLFEVCTGENVVGSREYGADYIKTSDFFVAFPFYNYGCIMKGKTLQIIIQGEVLEEQDTIVVSYNGYYICFRSNEEMCMKPAEEAGYFCISVDGSRAEVTMVATFHTDKQKALEECRDLYVNSEVKLEENRIFWDSYLNSCPLASAKNAGICSVAEEDFLIRQLWHWWCLLINVNDVEFNKLNIYMAPDRTSWKGIWSNDGQLCMAALSLTNQKELARRMMLAYLRASLNEDGVLSWYTHSDGLGCYGLKGDVGRFSHGSPYTPQMIDYYVKNSGDTTILSEKVGSRTVYDSLKKYLETLYAQRVNDVYGLVEWANLWETGWDDKGGCFFDNASLKEWCNVVRSGDDAEIASFYEKNQLPVIPIVEQVITLWGLYAMADLASKVGDEKYEKWCLQAANEMRNGVTEQCWNEAGGFYHDIDVKKDALSETKNADVFYWLYFEKNQERAEKIYAQLINEKAFDACYIPMLSMDSKGFNPLGYFSGGHWPREMSFVAMGLKRCGFTEKARELLVKAIMIAEGCILPEVVNPLDGKPTTVITKVAYNVMLVIALLDIENKVIWCEVE